ncbi:MAG: HIT family protein [Pseudobdellovibrionaceae bacterium]|jgi:histidine triad (HIT) family protein
MATIFTKIIHNELPSYKVYEDDRIIAILALDQVNLGHTLVIPKIEVNHWIDVPSEDFLAVQKASQKIGQAIHLATNCKRVCTMTVGFEVPHYHLHLIPAWNMAELSFARAQKRSENEMKEILEKIKGFLEL